MEGKKHVTNFVHNIEDFAIKLSQFNGETIALRRGIKTHYKKNSNIFYDRICHNPPQIRS